MSSDLVWQLVRNQSAYLVKGRTTQGDSTQFSSEPNNVTNINSQKFSGIANFKTVGVNVSRGKVVLTTTKPTRSKGNLKTRTVVLSKFNANGRNVGASAIRQLTGNSFYRADLTKYAVARYYALNKASAVKVAPASKAKRANANSKRR
jgi:large subunit ribosomal protein L28e